PPVTVRRLKPVSVLVAVMVTPGRGPPDSSRARPLRVEAADWAAAGWANSPNTAAATPRTASQRRTWCALPVIATFSFGKKRQGTLGLRLREPAGRVEGVCPSLVVAVSARRGRLASGASAEAGEEGGGGAALVGPLRRPAGGGQKIPIGGGGALPVARDLERDAAVEPDLEIGGSERAGAIEAGQGLPGAIPGDEEGPEPVPGLGVPGSGGDRAPVGGLRFGRPVQTAQGVAQVVERRRMPRIDRDGALELGSGAVDPSFGQEQDAEGVVGVGPGVVELDRALDRGPRLAPPAGALEGDGEVVPDVRVARRRFGRLAQDRDRVGRPAPFAQGLRQAASEGGVAGIGGGESAQLGDRPVGVARAEGAVGRLEALEQADPVLGVGPRRRGRPGA